MTKYMDEYLNLEQLLARCKELDPGTMIRIYFDPHVFRFFISYMDELDFFMSPTAFLIDEYRADGARLCIEIFISNAIRKLNLLDKE